MALISISVAWKAGQYSYPFRRIFNETYYKIAVAGKETMVAAADIIRTRGRQNIKASGNFNEKWLDDFSVKVYPTGDRPSAYSKVYITHKAGANFAGVFEYGQTVQSNRLMWVPFSSGARTPSGGKVATMSPKQAARYYGLEYIPPMDRRKVPILARKRKSHREKMQPVFFGIYRFTMEPKWHITEIVQDTADRVPAIFKGIISKLDS